MLLSSTEIDVRVAISAPSKKTLWEDKAMIALLLAFQLAMKEKTEKFLFKVALASLALFKNLAKC